MILNANDLTFKDFRTDEHWPVVFLASFDWLDIFTDFLLLKENL